MKVCFYFNWHLSPFLNALAVRLKGMAPSWQFCGLVTQADYYRFLSGQKELQYSELASLQEPYRDFPMQEIDLNYLQKAEAKYGSPNLWPMVYADRWLLPLYHKHKTYSHEEYLWLFQSYFKFIEAFLDNQKPDAIVFDGVAALPSYVLYAIAKARGIPTVIFTPARIGDYTAFSDDTFEGMNDALALFSAIRSGKKKARMKAGAREFLAQFRGKYDRDASNQYFSAYKVAASHFFSPGAYAARAARTLDYLYQYNFGDYRHDYSYAGKSLFRNAVDQASQQVRSRAISRMGVFEKPVQGEDYVFFPLHVEPELAIQVLAPMYMNQVALIENLAKSLPIGFRLYVKDHPAMKEGGFRSADFYNRIRQLPAVRLIEPAVPAYSMISGARLVATITGTAGLEAAFLKKPVISFGRVFFNALSGVKKCENPDLLPQMVADSIRSHRHNEEELEDFVSAIMESSFRSQFIHISGWSYPVPYEKVASHPDMETISKAAFEKLKRSAGKG